jgi:hypothetical protein
MEKDFAPHQEALELKQLGFDEAISTYYSFPDNELSYVMDGHSKVSVRRNSQFGHAVSAPTYSQAFRFFREKYELFSWIEKFHKNETYIFQIPPANFTKIQGHYTTYEEAELACVVKLIEIVKKQNLKG